MTSCDAVMNHVDDGFSSVIQLMLTEVKRVVGAANEMYGSCDGREVSH